MSYVYYTEKRAKTPSLLNTASAGKSYRLIVILVTVLQLPGLVVNIEVTSFNGKQHDSSTSLYLQFL